MFMAQLNLWCLFGASYGKILTWLDYGQIETIPMHHWSLFDFFDSNIVVGLNVMVYDLIEESISDQ